ncbi:MAG: hypothetical protein QXV82_09205 [Ignisphaera sp.]
MSRWGLTYKGVEPLFPEEWNRVVDALENLDKRIHGGTFTATGDGTRTVFDIPHDFTVKPEITCVGKGVSGLPDIDYWTVDDVYIHVAFKSPPYSGQNIVLWWLAIKL